MSFDSRAQTSAGAVSFLRRLDLEEGVEALRRALVLARHLPSVAEDVAAVEELWQRAREMSVRAQLRFGVGTPVRVVLGRHAGSREEVETIQANQGMPYWVRLVNGDLEAFGDDNSEIDKS